MSFDPYKDVDHSKIAKLGFPSELCNYIYFSESKKLQFGKLYSIEEAAYDKIEAILSGDPNGTIVKGDKVYMLPGHSLSQSRIKEYLKSIGATLTKNIEKATVIGGTNNFSESVLYGQAKVASIMIKLNTSHTIFKIVENNIDTLSDTFGKLPGYNLEGEFKTGTPCLMTNPAYKYIGYDSNMTSFIEGYTHFLTPSCMEVLYHILSGRLKIISDSVISNNANSGLKLADEESYEIISRMLNSGDQKDLDMAVNLLIHADLSGDITYNVWKLVNQFHWKVRQYDRSKALLYFIEQTKWDELNMDEQSFLEYAEERGLLTEKIVKELMSAVYTESVNNTEGYCNHEFFELEEDAENFTWTFKLKDKWINPKEKEVEYAIT